MSLDPRRLQRHLREAMRQVATPERAGAFTCYLHPQSTDPSLNVAIPDEPPEGRLVPVQGGGADPASDPVDLGVGLALVRARFATTRRAPRVEYVEEAHPELAEALAAEGFVQHARTHLLACTGATWRRVDPPEGASLVPILPATPWDDVRSYLLVQNEAFKLDMHVPERAPPRHWETLGLGAGLLVRLGGEPAGAGGLTRAQDGLADVRGLAVRARHRGQGLGTFLLSALGRIAHETGVEALLASPETSDEVALGARAGFEPVATLVSWRPRT